VEVHGVGVFGEVDELPDLGGVELGSLGDGLVPVLAVEQHDHGASDVVLVFVEGDGAGGDGGGLLQRGDGAEGGGDGGGLRGSGGDAELEDLEGSGEQRSMRMSARSAGPRVRRLSLTGAASRPWSVPIWKKGCWRDRLREKKRLLAALRRRSR
jgi:hypothetical protein